ncbi:MAG TPA: 50S ribosomal protein L29 [Acidimicrobiales bacterium]|jgi:large subunit ribosomal protein L29
MANKHVTELTELDINSLVEKLAEAKDELFKLRFQLAVGQQENTAKLREARKQIARINTLLRQREIAAAEGSI